MPQGMSQQGSRERFITRERGRKGKEATERAGKTSADVKKFGRAALLHQLLSPHSIRKFCAMTSSTTGERTVYSLPPKICAC